MTSLPASPTTLSITDKNMANAERQFSIVVFGASGFTGQFVVREVARNCKGKFKWAVAGRSKDKLEKVLQETADELGTCPNSGVVFFDRSSRSRILRRYSH